MLIAKAEIGQFGTDLRAHAFHVHLRGRIARLGRSLTGADGEQGKSENENAWCAAARVAHRGMVLFFRDNTRRTVLYSARDCLRHVYQK